MSLDHRAFDPGRFDDVDACLHDEEDFGNDDGVIVQDCPICLATDLLLETDGTLTTLEGAPHLCPELDPEEPCAAS